MECDVIGMYEDVLKRKFDFKVVKKRTRAIEDNMEKAGKKEIEKIGVENKDAMNNTKKCNAVFEIALNMRW